MTRKVLALGIAFILAISMLSVSVSLITSFTQDADAHPASCYRLTNCKIDSSGNLYDCIVTIVCIHVGHTSTSS